MTFDLSVLRTAGALAGHAAERHAHISKNIAHADTPGYRATDIEDFAKVFAGLDKGMPTHASMKLETVYRDGPMDPNGNTVVLEDEMMLAARAQQDHQLALSLYRSTMSMLKTAVGKNL